MSTRSIMFLKRGDKVRAVFVHWDGRNHGDTFRSMSNIEILELWAKLGLALKKSDQAWLDHFYSYNAWMKHLAFSIDGHTDEPNYVDQMLEISIRPQPSAFDPCFPVDEKGNVAKWAVNSKTCSIAEIKVKKFDPDKNNDPCDLFNAIKKNGKPLDIMCTELYWLFDIDTNKVWRADDKSNWKWKKLAPRQRKT